MKVIAIAAVALLAACAPKTEIRYLPPACPPVPQCTRPNLPIETNADLARAYLETESAFLQCKAARDTLAQCLKGEEQ